MGWKKMLLGEKMPDKNDPQYSERYEKEVKAGRKFASLLKIDKAAACVQCFACRRPKLFLALVFGIVIGCFTLNIYRIASVYNQPESGQRPTVVSHQERLLKEKRGNKPNKTEDINDNHRHKE